MKTPLSSPKFVLALARIGRLVVQIKVITKDDLLAGQTAARALSNEYSTYRTVKARFWPWHSGEGP
jgi:hypothetical protein